jgi:UPF0755 protein
MRMKAQNTEPEDREKKRRPSQDLEWEDEAAESERPIQRPRRSRGTAPAAPASQSEATQQVRPRKKKPAKKSNTIVSFIRVVFLLAGMLLCLALAAGAWASIRIPQMAEEKFGRPVPGLSLPQRVLYSSRLLANENNLLTPSDPQGKPRSFDVPLGETVNSIATRLEEESFISNADAFRTYLIYAGLDKGVQAGKYQLSPAMSSVQIAHTLQDSVPEEVDFNILSGWRAEEIAAALPTSGLAKVNPDEFLQIVHHPPADLLPADLTQLDSLDGFLMPGQYQIKRGISTHDLVGIFIKRFDETLTPELRDAFTNQKLDLPQAVTLASIVQREAIVADEQPTIASVFYNRLASGMKLDSDPTVQYAVGFDPDKQTWWKNPLTQTDLQIDSRYNTYMYPGLPPGPIANPGITALRAVAYPAQTDYFYFRAKCDGSGRHAFSKTYEEHLQNACP